MCLYKQLFEICSHVYMCKCFLYVHISSLLIYFLLIYSPHRSGNCLDFIFTDTTGVVAGNVGSPTGTSDHCYVSAIIKTEHVVPDISFSRKIYLKSQADWDGILNDLHELDWPDIYRQADFVASMNDGFERIIVRRIPISSYKILY